jgi:UDP-N-acetylenolpyruvoylglucosamine reductase
VSSTHGNIIVTEGRATAANVLALIARCRQVVQRQFGVELREEIMLLGFTASPAGRPAGSER